MRRFSSRIDLDELLEVKPPRLADDRADRREATRRGARAPRSSAAAASRRRVIPKAAICACAKCSAASSSNSSRSLGLELGEAGLDQCRCRARRGACATRSFSSAERDMPSPCMPSRRVASYSWIVGGHEWFLSSVGESERRGSDRKRSCAYAAARVIRAHRQLRNQSEHQAPARSRPRRRRATRR